MTKQDRKRHPAANGGKWLYPITRLAIYLRDGFQCAYCLRNLADVPANQRTVDHIVPVANGGTNDPSNLCLACKNCNDRKQDKPAWQFLWEEYNNDVSAYLARRNRLIGLLQTPLNRQLARAIIDGTLDLSDVLKKEQP